MLPLMIPMIFQRESKVYSRAKEGGNVRLEDLIKAGDLLVKKTSTEMKDQNINHLDIGMQPLKKQWIGVGILNMQLQIVTSRPAFNTKLSRVYMTTGAVFTNAMEGTTPIKYRIYR